MRSTEFLLGLLDRDDNPCVSGEDFDGPHATAIRRWQQAGFVGREPGVNPVPSCPHCGAGVPYRLGERYICPACRSAVGSAHLLLWPVAREAFLGWLAKQWRLSGGVRGIDPWLWQLGTLDHDGDRTECFYRRGGVLTEVGRMRLSAYRNVVAFVSTAPPPEVEHLPVRHLSLLELLREDDGLAVCDLAPLLSARGNVRFEEHSGTIWVADAPAGEVPVGSKEYAFLHCLARHLDQFVPYADLKREVLRSARSGDATEEATFCQNLKSRIKKKWVPAIDRLVVTTNKADGYRLRGYAELS